MFLKIFSLSKVLFHILELSKINEFVPLLNPASAMAGFGLATDKCLSQFIPPTSIAVSAAVKLK